MPFARMNRRRLIQQAAIGAAALPTLGSLTTRGSAAAPATQPVELEFWTPANDPVGAPIITGLTDEFNNTVGKEKGIHVNARIKPVPDSGDYTQYTTAMKR